jgi:hypothetical protein
VRDQPQQRRLETRRLADLRAFDAQGDFFADLPEHELRALADDIDRNGLRQPIEVLPEDDAGIEPDTILSGRQRKRALEHLGGTTTRVASGTTPPTRHGMRSTGLSSRTIRTAASSISKPGRRWRRVVTPDTVSGGLERGVAGALDRDRRAPGRNDGGPGFAGGL